MHGEVPDSRRWLNEFLDSFAERFGKNMPKIAARMLGVLLLTERDALSSHELVELLGASPASVSNSGRLLLRYRLVERTVSPETRRDLYRLRDDVWVHLYREDEQTVKETVKLLDDALADEQGPTGLGAARTREMRDFYAFLHADVSKVMDRYEQWRAEQRRDQP